MQTIQHFLNINDYILLFIKNQIISLFNRCYILYLSKEDLFEKIKNILNFLNEREVTKVLNSVKITTSVYSEAFCLLLKYWAKRRKIDLNVNQNISYIFSSL